MKLFLDDIRQVFDAYRIMHDPVYSEKSDWHIVRNYKEFKDFILDNEMPQLISFDHDLADNHYIHSTYEHINYAHFTKETGYHCLLWFLNYVSEKKLRLPRILIHTQNNPGRRNMETLLNAFKLIH